MDDAAQTPVVAALASGQACCEPGPLKRIDTHMSRLFLGRERVYKLYRAVRHPFADLTSLEARRGACTAELGVNKALAPDLYLAARPVVLGADGAIRIGGQGEALDWAVVMRRFPDGALFSEMAEAGRLTAALIAEAADVVARFHAALPPHPDAGRAANYLGTIEGLRRTEAEGAAALGARPASEDLFDGLEREVARLTPLIEARRRGGWVRRGHGDLHLRNICLFEGAVTPFDAIGFDAAMATTDVVYDFAFLLMDLRERGRADLANVAMNRYWDASGQPEEALALLPLFTALRAAVRMAVAVEGGDLDQAARYRALGRRLLHRAAPRLVAVGGLSGSGKSTIARALAPGMPGPCGARLLSSDIVRKREAGLEPTARLGAAAYGPKARAAVYGALSRAAAEALDAGSSVIADATFREATARSAIEAASSGFAFTGLWLTAPPAVRAARVSARSDDASDATAAVALAQTEPRSLGPNWRAWNADRPPDALVAELRVDQASDPEA